MLQKRVPVEVGLLRLFYALIQRVDEASLAECWPLLLSLLKEGLQLNLTPPSIFQLLAYLLLFESFIYINFTLNTADHYLLLTFWPLRASFC